MRRASTPVVCLALLACWSCLATSNAQAQQDLQRIVEPPHPPGARGVICYYITAYKYAVDENGNTYMIHKQLCCSSTDLGEARDCVMNQLVDDWQLDDDKGPVYECSDKLCPASTVAVDRLVAPKDTSVTTSSVITVQLKCCGKDGRMYVAEGVGLTWKQAFCAAKTMAIEAGNRHYGGLKCYYPPTPPAPPAPCAKPAPVLSRLLDRIFCR